MENGFRYTYSGANHAEIEEIRQKYIGAQKPDDKLEQIRRLDKSCERPGTYVAVAVGLLGTLLFAGSFIMMFGVNAFVPGVVAGVLGLCLMGIAVPVFRLITARCRKKIAPEILKLIEELERPSD